MRAAIRYASEREKGGILMPGDVDEKTGDLVSETLESKHPIGRDVKINILPIFESCPELTKIGPDYRYFPEESKSILIVRIGNRQCFI